MRVPEKEVPKCIGSNLVNSESVSTRHSYDRSYLPPKTRGMKPYTPPGSDLLVWEYEAGGRPYAIVFAKKGDKPLWHLAFTSEKARERHIETTIADRMSQRIVDRFMRENPPTYRRP